MTVEVLVFLVLLLSTLVNLGVQLYIHFEAYPLIPFVGKPEFAKYIAEYENRLAVPLLLPYAVSLLSAIIALIIPMNGMSRIGIGAAFLSNLAVAVVTLQVVTPIYERQKASGSISAEGMAELLRINWARLGLTLASGLILLALLADLLTI